MGVRKVAEIRVQDMDQWVRFKDVAQSEGFGLGAQPTLWHFVVHLLDYYQEHQVVDSILDRIDRRIQELRSISPIAIRDIVRKVVHEEMPPLVRAAVRLELEKFEQEVEGE